ncbi:hypothetical protein B0H10DRAFT_1994737 [Mycena sp. CBHHK59/15]|nr:hypothetical protein B0H10DRAFT_1994737 [Mycena sp. CBHHK59/15]
MPKSSPSKVGPSTPSPRKSRPVWRSPIKTPIGGTPLAAPSGPSIKRTEATKRYKIKATDLDTIAPISRQPNHMGGSAPIQVYNECDVIALTEKIRPGKPLPLPQLASPSTSPIALAKKSGRRIMRSTAIQEFNLTPAQMDQLNPVSTTPNAYGSVTKYYNRCDVENLKQRVQELRAASSNRGASSSNHYADNNDYEDNIFDGLSSEDATALRRSETKSPSRSIDVYPVAQIMRR